MGQWSLLPLDTETWMSGQGNKYFKKYFGVPKGILVILTLTDFYQHAYAPVDYFNMLSDRLKQITKTDYRGLEKILVKVYPLIKKVKAGLQKNSAKDYSKISNQKLVKLYKNNRDLVHHITVFDQFAWLAEENSTLQLQTFLIDKLKLTKDSGEFNRVLFALTKPEEISTTLTEKRSVLEQVIAVKKKQKTLEKAAQSLTKKFNWLPVFCFGDAWEVDHYREELDQLTKKPLIELNAEFEKLKKYKKIRNQDIANIAAEYHIHPQDLQPFIDFGLALDGRNEAEYCVSYGGYYVRPMYEEIARRLYISVKQLRTLYEKEIMDALLGKANVEDLLKTKGSTVAYGYSKDMSERINFSEKESKKLFDYIESYVKPVQGGDETKGTCASPGKVTGKIRIVPSPTQNSKVQEGDVLVTYATTTDYLPAMKRAAAIITEVGGLTCHAAVVSREFGIPCIIALAGAMKNFKDGEMVEVDADNGTIKKL